jgi:hypothetical protein
MPMIYLAHQAPLLPIVRRWPRKVDGLALMVGSMSPDFAYALNGTRFEFFAHVWPELVLFCVPVTLVVAWLVARGLARVVAGHLPELGAFHLGDYRALAAHRFLPVRAALSALAGALSHALLDHLGHAWGWPAQHFAFYREPLSEALFLERPWTVHRIVQYAGHLLLTPLCLGLLHRYGRERWLAAEAATVRPFRPSLGSHAVLWGSLLAGLLAATPFVSTYLHDGGRFILRLSAGAFTGLLLGAGLARRFEAPERPTA